nr:MAG TPA: structural protein [Caudoviricetes sp.]
MTKYLDNEGLTHFTGKMKEYADGKAGEVDSKVTSHISDKKNNPHDVTKAQVGLGSVDNVRQIPLSQKGVANGVATLDANGKIPVAQMPETKTINEKPIFGKGNLQLSASLYEIVDALPTTGIDTSKIYLVPASATTAKNNKTEYIYLGDPNKTYDESKWEKLGDEQKSSTITTPGGSIKVDTALIKDSPNPVAGGVVKAKFDEVDGKLAKKVESSDYTTKMTAIDSKLKTLENKTIDVDAELKDSTNPVQNRAVNAAVQNLNTEIGKKANDADLTKAKGRIDTLESNSISINDITLIPVTDGNGIASIEKQNKKLVITQGKFVTSLAGYVTSGTLNTTLAGYAKSDTLASYYTKKEIDGKGYLTEHQSLAGYVNEIKEDITTSGNGIAGITKVGKVLKVTKSTFLTAHQSLAGYATQTWVNEQGFAIGTIPTKVSDLKNDSGFLTQQSLNGYWNQLYVDERDGNGIADIWVDVKNKSELCVSKRKFITPETLGTSIDDYAKDKGYLTKDNLNEKLKETVTIKLVSDKSASDTNLNGATVTVKSGDTTVSTQTWQGTPIEVKVPCDKDVTIEAAAVKMYVKPKALKYVPSPLYNREVVFTYKALETGTFIIDKNDNLYGSPAKCEEAGLSKTDMVGVLLVTNNVAIVIAPKIISNLIWSNKRNLIEGCATFPNYLDALKDFAGAANTAAIIGADSNSYIAARLCSDYVFKNGKKGYLMSVGEAKELAENFYWIGQKLTYINDIDAPSESGKYWTSTQMNANSAWGFSMNRTSPSEVIKTVQTNAFAIYSLYD